MAVSRYLKKRIDEYRNIYGKTEYEVMEITKDTFGGEVEKASDWEDRTMHVDFWWYSPKKGKIGIDVKGIKKNDKKEFDDSFQWLEFQNVIGKKGWLYGEEEYIAFKTFERIVYIKRSVLKKYAEEKKGDKEPVIYKPKDYFIPYTRKRWGRKDITMKVPMADIIKLAEGTDENGKPNGFFAVFDKKRDAI